MKEIERKFLVDRDRFPGSQEKSVMKQGYLSVDPERVVRIRREDDTARLTIKGKMEGITRPEFEYAIPPDEADELLKLALPTPIEKVRYMLNIEGSEWEVDEFLGENLGLWVAEIELESEEQSFTKPPWLGEEVTHDRRYYNSQLSQNPWSRWNER